MITVIAQHHHHHHHQANKEQQKNKTGRGGGQTIKELRMNIISSYHPNHAKDQVVCRSQNAQAKFRSQAQALWHLSLLLAMHMQPCHALYAMQK
jgi:hypothetical protein